MLQKATLKYITLLKIKKIIMKALFLTLLVSAGTVFTSNAQTTDGAKLEFKKETHDYGTVKNGSDGTCTFEFKNTGNAPLIISRAQGSCGCTVPEYPKEPIAPGATAVITVKYDTNRTGNFSKNVTIYSNAVNAPEKVIYIKGEVMPKPEGGMPVNNSGAPANN